MIDDVRIYSRALTRREIARMRRIKPMFFRRHSARWLALLALTLAGVAAGFSGCKTPYQPPKPPPGPVTAWRPTPITFTPLIRDTDAALIRALPQTASVPLLWDASPDPMAGYAMYYGVTGGVTNRLDVGPTLQVTVSNLTVGADYWFFAVAYDTNATESLPSNTLLYTPPGSSQVFTYTIQHWLTNGMWTNYITVLATNPPPGMFRVAMELKP